MLIFFGWQTKSDKPRIILKMLFPIKNAIKNIYCDVVLSSNHSSFDKKVCIIL